MIASSPTSAALLRSTSSCSPTPAFSAQSRYYDQSASASHNPTSASSSIPAAPATSPQASRLNRISSESNGCSGVEEIRSALRRQTVDVGTQCSRPATPTRAAAASSISTSSPTHTRQAPSPNVTSSSGVRQGIHHQVQGNPTSQMPPTTTGSKRNTPDTATLLSSASSAPAQPTTDEPQTGSLSKRPRPENPPTKVLPRHYEEADTRDLVVLVSSMLMELIRFNDQIPLQDGRLTRFHSRSPPRISVQDYLQRLTTHATLSPPILLSIVFLIDRLCALYPAFTISSLTVHRFLISSATVASKGLSDSFWTNKTYARVGGISVAELALLELELLWRVEWRIVPQPEVLVDYYRSLVERCEEYVIEPEAESTTTTQALGELAGSSATSGNVALNGHPEQR
ncbi:hypothetical protein AJ80_05524 [Polytolypa hystricis UAMH7299]|uniref:Cyclin-dependent protein kinase regulator Pho80 n=1 Tax=Polytolypa hystricis (strain UAMH7299) TaxID=1447883 RepID=A0A2B7Y4A3_POLH7|nr:hypothetical protein AJ80_05524 [Polytolypa hystricis UAMH7299]